MIMEYAIALVVELAILNCGTGSDPRSVQPNVGQFGSTFPGTLWCGPGNTAQNEKQLGQLKNIDRCCRAHDGCKDVITKFSGKNGLFNPTMSPKYNCTCDKSFKDCLMRVPRYEGAAAEFVGSMYFESRIFPNCFTYDFPKKCVDKSKTTPWRCNAYKNTSTKKKTWQWLDFGNWFTDFTTGF